MLFKLSEEELGFLFRHGTLEVVTRIYETQGNMPPLPAELLRERVLDSYDRLSGAGEPGGEECRIEADQRIVGVMSLLCWYVRGTSTDMVEIRLADRFRARLAELAPLPDEGF